MQQSAKQDQARSAGQWLAGEIDNLRKKVAEAEARVEDFRGNASGLFVGTNNTNLSNQQMGEINTQLSNARGQKSDAESKARLIRMMLQSGQPIEASEVLNSELVRRLSEQRVTLRAQIAEQSATLLDGHPRIRELRAQVADLDRQIREEAGKISRSLENDAKIAGARAESMSSSLEQLKKQAVSTNGQDVQLRALEREAKAQRDLLESYLAKFREASTRENLETGPTDARIISKAIVSNIPAFPKKLPIVLIATLATLMLSAGSIVTGELLRMTAPRASAGVAPVASVAAVQPVAPIRDTHPELAAPISDFERIAADLKALGDAARKITVMGVSHPTGTALTALTLARMLGRDSSAVLVDMAMSPTLKAVMADPAAPGLSDLAMGTASFGQIIGKDRMSRVQIVSGGSHKLDAAMLHSPRLMMTIDALMRVYDHVVLDAGSLDEIPEHLVATNAHAVLIATGLDAQTREVIRNELLGAGFRGVTMLDAPADPSQIGQPGGRMAAA
jgi:pimeloyl-ACP methyl ester carboxylesterase/capsule polysaccharide export protein KpsE/RkpR